MATVLVTGAAGFIGRALCRQLVASGWEVRGATRSPEQVSQLSAGVVPALAGDLGASPRWAEALAGVDVVVHLAVHHHVLSRTTPRDLELFRRVNVSGSRDLALQAAAAGVRRLIYLSSAKIHGEGLERPYTERDLPCPATPYGASKWKAELVLHQTAEDAGLELSILRPPLVYGPGVKANFLSLLGWVYHGYPLPLGRVRNRRSLLYVGNLVAAVTLCLRHPAASGETFLVNDGEDRSTPELVKTIAAVMGRPARLLPLPVDVLKELGRICGRRAAVDRLTGSFSVDADKIRNVLGWQPSYSLSEGLEETVRWFLQSKRKP